MGDWLTHTFLFLFILISVDGHPFVSTDREIIKCVTDDTSLTHQDDGVGNTDSNSSLVHRKVTDEGYKCVSEHYNEPGQIPDIPEEIPDILEEIPEIPEEIPDIPIGIPAAVRQLAGGFPIRCEEVPKRVCRNRGCRWLGRMRLCRRVCRRRKIKKCL